MDSFKEFSKVTTKGGYLGYELTESSRSLLLSHFKPKYSRTYCEHVTYKFPAQVGDDMPPAVKEAHVVGYQDGKGIEALVVEINGTTKRPDAAIYHITLSLDPALKKPFHSNELLKQHGFNHVQPLTIHLEPKHFR